MPFLLSQSWASVRMSSVFPLLSNLISLIAHPSFSLLRRNVWVFSQKIISKKDKDFELDKKKKSYLKRFSESTFSLRLFETSVVFFLLFKTAAEFCSFQRCVYIKLYFHGVHMIDCVCVCLRTSRAPICEHIASSNNHLWITMMVITSAELLSWVQ